MNVIAENMDRIQQTIQARMVLQRESIASQLAELRELVLDGIAAGLTTPDLAERSGLDAADVEAMRP